jgi:hypothetical protein
MRRYVVMAAAVVACGAIALAAPSRADQYDFISQLDNSGVWYESVLDMIDIGRELCHELRHGVTPPMVLGKLANTGFAPAESAIVLMSAVDHLCPDVKPDVVGWARDHGYTGPV